jgi:hypothetical protein
MRNPVAWLSALALFEIRAMLMLRTVRWLQRRERAQMEAWHGR